MGCERGNGDAFFNLGHIYFKGKGIDKDFDKAFELFDKAFKLGVKKAQRYLKLCKISKSKVDNV